MKPRSKIILPKNISLKYFSYSHCASTNDSKEHRQLLIKQNSLIQRETIPKMKDILRINLQKYTTSKQQFYLNYFQINMDSNQSKETSFNVKKKLLKTFIKDCSFDRLQQNMQKVFEAKQIEKELTQLTEYYKYYTNNPILYHKENFKILYHYYERKKYIQYKRLKAILSLQGDSGQNLSSTSKNQNISQADPQIINQDTFYVGPFLNLSQVSQHKISRQQQRINQNSLCQSEAFQNLNFQMNYLISNNNKKMVPLGQKQFYGSFQSLLRNKNKRQLNNIKNALQISQLDRMYDFTKKQPQKRHYKNIKSKNTDNHSSKKLSKITKFFDISKEQSKSQNKFHSQVDNSKQQTKLLQLLNKINIKTSVNFGSKKKNRRLNSCKTFLNNNTEGIPNNSSSSKVESNLASIKKRSRNIRSLQKIQTLKSQIERQKVSDFKIFIQKQHKVKERLKRSSNFASNNCSPDFKKYSNKKLGPIFCSYNSLDKKTSHKDSKSSIQQFLGNSTSNLSKKISNLHENTNPYKECKLKQMKNSKQSVIECGIQSLKKKIKQQKQCLLVKKDLKYSKIVTSKKQKKQTLQQQKKKGTGNGYMKSGYSVNYQKVKK